MTTHHELASIERVDLRMAWPGEATDFTPWLANNLSKLGDALELELELQAQEAPVGSYSLDILARDTVNGGLVVIENQLESTDRTHLGQLLTYAAGFDATVAVWIAKEFKSEHREALDMLNRRTGGDTQFFGVEVELWKIDDSRPAPNFRLVAFPNEWRKQAVGIARGLKRFLRGVRRTRVSSRPSWMNSVTSIGSQTHAGPGQEAGPRSPLDLAALAIAPVLLRAEELGLESISTTVKSSGMRADLTNWLKAARP